MEDFGHTRDFCPDHTGQEERVKGLNGKMDVLIWICGVGMTLNLLVIGGAAAYITGTLSAQSNEIGIIRVRQDRVLLDLSQVCETQRNFDRRLDALEKKLVLP